MSSSNETKDAKDGYSIPPGTSPSIFAPHNVLAKSQQRDLKNLLPADIYRIRTGFSRVVSAREFKASYQAFAARLDACLDPADFELESDLNCNDVLVETPSVVIENAIEREVQLHKDLFAVAREMRQEGKHLDLTRLPEFGATIPRLHELERPLANLKRQRLEFLSRKSLPLSRNTISSTSILKKIKNAAAPTPLSISEGSDAAGIAAPTGESDLLLNATDNCVPLDRDQVLLRVAVYDTVYQWKTQEFLVLDDQPLTALRDLIRCVEDDADAVDWTTQQLKSEFTECSSTSSSSSASSSSASSSISTSSSSSPPSSSLLPRVRKACARPTPSGFFLIENVFFDDMRNPNAHRYSDPIVAWVQQKDRFALPSLFPYSQRLMQDTTFGELRLRLGSQYLYQHMGDCRHVLVFTEMRARGKDDVDNKACYPLEVYHRREPAHKCGVCDHFMADLVLYGDRLAESNPFFTCARCYDMMHKDADGQLLYDDFQVFKVLPFKKTIPKPPPQSSSTSAASTSTHAHESGS